MWLTKCKCTVDAMCTGSPFGFIWGKKLLFLVGCDICSWSRLIPCNSSSEASIHSQTEIKYFADRPSGPEKPFTMLCRMLICRENLKSLPGVPKYHSPMYYSRSWLFITDVARVLIAPLVTGLFCYFTIEIIADWLNWVRLN